MTELGSAEHLGQVDMEERPGFKLQRIGELVLGKATVVCNLVTVVRFSSSSPEGQDDYLAGLYNFLPVCTYLEIISMLFSNSSFLTASVCLHLFS